MSIQTATERLREYEVIYVLAPNADNAEAERVNAKVSEVVSSFGGKLLKLDNWGRRKLAYPIKRHTRGIFVYVKYIAQTGAVSEMERNLRIADSVLRYQSNLTNPAVESLDIEIDPEEVVFAPVAPAEPEEELTYEQRLGLAPSIQRKAASEDEEGLDGDDDDTSDNLGSETSGRRGEA